jgi:hypothetical protein
MGVSDVVKVFAMHSGPTLGTSAIVGNAFIVGDN